jgi:V/A-type H+-transporting ATPase subunit I
VIEEAQETEKKLHAAQVELPRMANSLDDIIRTCRELKVQALYHRAQNGAWAKDALFAIQGWVPADAAGTLAEDLTSAGVDSAVQTLDPAEDEIPPTLIRYPRWVKPIKALFAILGTVPGYREYDLAPFFMLALPLFSAMLIGDAGYGLIFTLVGLLGYKKIVAKAGKPAVQLILAMGITTMVWGILTANYFGVTPVEFMHAGGFDSIEHMEQGHGFWAALGTLMVKPAVFWSADPEIARNILIKLSFLFGCTHLVLAHLRQVVGLAPNIRCLAEVGWSVFLVGMLGVVWMLFFPTDPIMPSSLMLALLGGGFAFVVLFSHPHRNPLKWLGIGMVANILPLISTFSDTISYIRLMAVGLASYYIASAFNGLAYQVGENSVWLIPASVLILLFAHLLNIALGLIAIFAHGVRLNMLEFSSNAGVQWQGYAYAPFARTAKHTDQ